VRDEREVEVRGVDHEQHDRDPDAQGRDGRGPRAEHALERGRQHEPDRRERQHRRLRAGARRVEVLLRPVPGAAGEHRGAEHEQDVPDDRAGEGCLHHVGQTLAERRDGDDQFGGVAERRVEKAADAFARMVRQRLRRAAHPSGQRQDGESRREEDPQVPFWREMLERDRQRPASQERKPSHSTVRPSFCCRRRACLAL
jgi:hypothetical protein